VVAGTRPAAVSVSSDDIDFRLRIGVHSGIVADLREPGAGEVLLGSPDVQRIRELLSG